VALKHDNVFDLLRDIYGSRNAVVALKPLSIVPYAGLKRLKQERRGGIETRAALRDALYPMLEAGTPWWH